MLFYHHNVYKVTESDFGEKLKHYVKQCLRPFLKFAYQLKSF